MALAAAMVTTGLPAGTGEPSARDLYKRGRKFEKKGDFASAYLAYSQAAAAAPAHKEYWQRAQALQRKAITAASVMPALTPLPAEPSPQVDEPRLAPATIEELVESRRPQPPIEVQASM